MFDRVAKSLWIDAPLAAGALGALNGALRLHQAAQKNQSLPLIDPLPDDIIERITAFFQLDYEGDEYSSPYRPEALFQKAKLAQAKVFRGESRGDN